MRFKHTIAICPLALISVFILLTDQGCKKQKNIPVLPVTISAITPLSGSANTVVTITGTNFKTTSIIDNSVSFNGAAATVLAPVTATKLTVVTPPGGKTGVITISNIDGTATSPVFTYFSPKPTITSISPTSGPANATVTITGTDFKTTSIGANSVSFNGAAATVLAPVTATKLTVVAPPGGKTGVITVSNIDGTATSPVFTYFSPKPTITSISPTSGPANATVTITGTDFKTTSIGANSVSFNGAAATVLAPVTATKLTVVAPPGGKTGVITVSNIDGTATSPVFTYINPKPTITSISPTSGSSNTTVTITGANFKTITASNTVKFNGASATVQTATATQLTVLAPAGGTTGAVSATTADGTATGPLFTYTIPTHDVYVLGQTASGFCYWKNGIRTDLPADAQTPNAAVTSIFVSGSDIYVGGTAGTGNPAYWKNAAGAVTLPNNGQGGYVYSIYVSGPDVYTAGGDFNGSVYTLVYWKNTSLHYLNMPSGSVGASGLAAGMTLNGSNVYVCGNLSTNSGINRNATYWKNGTATVLTNVTSASANAIFISQTGDLYLAGNVSGISQYWKNGVGTLLSPNPNNGGIGPGRKIYVSGTNVYVVGQSNGAAKYWKNGIMAGLTTQDFNASTATCIFGTGNDIYIGGCSYGQVGNSKWGYWVNGAYVNIPGAINVYDIFIK